MFRIRKKSSKFLKKRFKIPKLMMIFMTDLETMKRKLKNLKKKYIKKIKLLIN